MERRWLTGAPAISTFLIGLLVFSYGGVYYLGQNNSFAEIQRLETQLQTYQQQLTQARTQLQKLQQNLTASETKLNQNQELLQLMEQELIVPDSFFDSNRTDTWGVSGGHIQITKLQVSPGDTVKEGEIQAFALNIESQESPVKEVTATIKTDQGNITIQFKLVSGIRTNGRWVGFWLVKDIAGQGRRMGGEPAWLPCFEVTFRIINEAGDIDSMLFICEHQAKKN